MKNILVPIDFSSDSINALEHAINLSGKAKADIEMIHVQKSKQFHVPDYFHDIDKFYGHAAEDYLKILYEKYKDKTEHQLFYKVRHGKVFREISEYADQSEADLIIMGTHGISGFEKFYIGSNAYKVVSHAPCPVITIRSGFLRNNISKIVLPVDITTETRQKVPFTVEIARYFDAEIHIVSVSETNSDNIVQKLEYYVNQVDEYISDRNIKTRRDALIGSNITEITIEYAISINAELISIMTEQAESTKNIYHISNTT